MLPRSFQAHQGLAIRALLSLRAALTTPTPSGIGISSASKEQFASVRPSSKRPCLVRTSSLGSLHPSQEDQPGFLPCPTLARTFSKEAGLTREKQIRKTSLGGREGRRGPCGKCQKALNGLRPQHTHAPGPWGLYPSHPAPAGTPVVPYSLGVGEWPQAVVVLLPGGVPQPQVDGLPIHHHIRRIVVETAETERSASVWVLSPAQTCSSISTLLHPRNPDQGHLGPTSKPRGASRTGAHTLCSPPLDLPACSHCGDVLSGEGVGCVADQQAGLPHGAVERRRAHVAPRPISALRSARAAHSHGPRVGTGVLAQQIRSERGTEEGDQDRWASETEWWVRAAASRLSAPGRCREGGTR